MVASLAFGSELTPIELAAPALDLGARASTEVSPLKLATRAPAEVSLIRSGFAAELPGVLRGRRKVAPALRSLTFGPRRTLGAASIGVRRLSAASRGAVAARTGLVRPARVSITAAVKATALLIAESPTMRRRGATARVVTAAGPLRGSIPGIVQSPGPLTRAPISLRIGFAGLPPRPIGTLPGFLALLESPGAIVRVERLIRAISSLPGLLRARVGARFRLGQCRRRKRAANSCHADQSEHRDSFEC